MERVGILGTGLAGLRAAAELRSAGFAGQITAWDAEAREPYDRPPLTKSLFDDRLRPLARQGLGDLAELDVQVLPEAADSLDRSTSGSLRISGIDVDAAIIATGASPQRTIPGAHVVHTVDDAASLASAIRDSHLVRIVGAGWIGTEIASVAADAGARVELWEATEHILGRSFHGAVDDLWREWMADAGVEVRLGVRLAEAEGDCAWAATGTAEAARGRDVADVLVQATGSTPALGFLGVEADRTPRGGLATGPLTRVLHRGLPIPGLYAVGDCADTLFPGIAVEGGHWTKALNDGRATAAAILGTAPPKYAPPPEVFSTQFGHEIGLVGTVPEGVEAAAQRVGDGTVMRWERDGELLALLAVDAPRDLARARRRLRIPLGGA